MKKTTNFQLLALLLLHCTSFLSAQTTWTGTTSTNWSVATNWSAGVPDASDDVLIPDVSGASSNDPVIMNGTMAEAKSVEIETSAKLTIETTGELHVDGATANGINIKGAVENSGDIIVGNNQPIGSRGIDIFYGSLINNASGTIQIEETTSHGIYFSGGTFTNAGAIKLGINKKVGAAGMVLYNGFTNSSGATIQIEETVGAGIFNDGHSGFTNSGSITIGVNKKTGSHGIHNENGFTNTVGANIQIEETGANGINNESGFKIFTNAGTITIGVNKKTGQTGIRNYSGEFNNTHIIQIEETGTHGIFNNKDFNNSGTITIGVNKKVGGSGIYNGGADFDNTGDIQIEETGSHGIQNEPDGRLNNWASITIGVNKKVGGQGIHNNFSRLTNHAGATIQIEETVSHGIFSDESIAINNSGTITIGANKKVGGTGIYNDANSNPPFNNLAGGIIQIEEVGGHGIYNEGYSTFNNAGTINIGANKPIGIHGIQNKPDAKFNNNGCAALVNIVADAIINNSGTFGNNGGIIMENAAGNSSITSNTGTVLNLNGGIFTIGSGNAAVTALAQIWTGCVSTDWDNADNWLTSTVPTATDDVTIPDVTNDPIIMNGTAAVAKSVTVNTDANLHISNGASLTIDGATGNGLLNFGMVENHGTINIDNTELPGINNTSQTAIFNNFKTINIGQNGGIGNIKDQGLFNGFEATFNNNTGGTINIDNTSQNGISQQNANTTFNNFATINIGQNGGAENIKGQGLLNGFETTFNNNIGGVINIDNTLKSGIFNADNAFNNFATINIGQNGGAENIKDRGLFNGFEATFNNNIGGVINIDNTLKNGISQQYANTIFNNSATINIGQNGGAENIKGQGLSNRLEAIFNNNTGGVINIDNTLKNGIFNADNAFNNFATINIGQNGGAENIKDQGLFNGFEATFNNNTGGTINIDNTSQNGISQQNANTTFNNFATINIGQNDGNINNHGIAVASESNFTNSGNQSLIKIDNIGFTNSDGDGLIIVSGGTLQNLDNGQILIGHLNGNLPSEGIACVDGSKVINDNSTIDIDNAQRWGIEIISGGAVENRAGAKILIGQKDGNIGSNGINLKAPNSSFTNDDGVINIDISGSSNTDADAILAIDESIFKNLNKGQIFLGQKRELPSEGIACINGGHFINDDASITIDSAGRMGIELLTNATFENKNNGQILIGQNKGKIEQDGINVQNLSTFINDASTIRIDSVKVYGLRLTNSIFENKNNGQLLIGQIGDMRFVGIFEWSTSTIINEASTIRIDNVDGDGFWLNASSFENKNNGQLLIGQTGPIGRIGIFPNNSSSFTNDGSTIKIDDTGSITPAFGRGINVQYTSTFSNINDAELMIGQLNRFHGNTGIMSISSNFVNDGSNISIDDYDFGLYGLTVEGLKINTNTNQNGGHITIGANSVIDSIGLTNDSVNVLNNLDCSIIETFGDLFNRGTITNEGLMSFNTSQTHNNDSTLINNGIVHLAQLPEIPNITNNGIVLSPTTGSCTDINPAFDIGSLANLNLLGIFTDANATNPAGTFDEITNTFTPNNILPQGTFDYYIEIEQTNAGCSHILPWQLTVDFYLHPCCPPTNVLFVDESTPNDNNGFDWNNAFTDLQLALHTAKACSDVTEIWVADGTYLPTSNTDRSASFVLENDVTLYGGFAGGESNLTERDWSANTASLSGDIGTPNDNSDNSYHVIFNKNNGATATAVLDGFTISHGNANDIGDDEKGGGMYNENASPTIRNCHFSSNNAAFGGGGTYFKNSASKVDSCYFSFNSAGIGGGIFNSTNATTEITYSHFTDNNATTNGGAIFNNSALLCGIMNCHFSNNSSSEEGGAIDNLMSSPDIFNSAFLTNSADEGGAINNRAGSDPNIVNCSFHENTATSYGGAIRNHTGTVPLITNCIVWGNTAGIVDEEISNAVPGPIISYSIIKQASGVYPGTGNLNIDPLFTSSSNLQLLACSPAINTGSDVANGTLYDLSGKNRKVGIIDMGAFELQGTVSGTNTWTGSGDGMYWNDATNWSDHLVPGRCQHVVIPTGHEVTLPANIEGLGKTLEVEIGTELITDPNASMDIGN